MKLIFLDIDGVLVTERHGMQNGFDSVCMNHFIEIIKETSANIVISSSWRLSRSLEELKDLFRPFGLEERIIGMTPFLDFVNTRSDEIRSYLENNDNEIKNFVIVDDEEPLEGFETKVVRTTIEDGITMDIKNKIIDKLN